MGDAAAATIDSKLDTSALATLTSGVLANMLVCLAVWMATFARTLSGKVAVIIGPVAIFVAAGFEHSIANMSLLPIGWSG
ncbi:formate/nitrite transporter family protein [Sphingomonas aerolata]|uniref:formate/nitrite transporter family protein n=1 Tax=Sphingomonas aerolata TaxID=185951 RepID=UPI0033651E39